MSATLTLEILTPERKQSIEGILALTVHLADGSLGILPGHLPLLAHTNPAPLYYRCVGGDEGRLNLGAGILLVERGKVTIFIAGAETHTAQAPLRLLQDGLAKVVDGDQAYAKEG
ncbi:MAG: hypothetical protein IH586_15785 [Anaerolineaceae bacterium]|nr:hypothetical protein [Anaerolineaceae bacterium]